MQGFISLLKGSYEVIAHKDEVIERKDAQLERLNTELLAARVLASDLQFRNLAKLRLANVTELRGALDVCLKSQNLRGSSAGVLAAFLAASPLCAAAALRCCNQDAKVLGDNDQKEHTAKSLSVELARIKRRFHKDSHPMTSPKQYRVNRDRLLLARDGLSDADVVVLSCFFEAYGYPVRVVDDAQLADPPP